MDYICLKIGLSTWGDVLSEVRAGRLYIDKNSKTHHTSRDKASTAIEGRSTNRNSQKRCECESPILSEASIKHIRGDETDRSDSSFDEVEQQLNPKLFASGAFAKTKADSRKE